MRVRTPSGFGLKGFSFVELWKDLIDMNRKIIMIGPVYPYKGGISHYTGLMYRELVKRNDVEMLSYKMQ